MFLDSQLVFVPYSRDFLTKSWEWLNDPEIKALTLTPDFSREQQEIFYASLALRTDYLVWGVALDGQPIGACGLKHITKDEAEYWGYIGEKQYWGRGLGRQMIEHCEEIARTRGCKVLYLHVGVDNARARRLYARDGFVEVESACGAEVIMRKTL